MGHITTRFDEALEWPRLASVAFAAAATVYAVLFDQGLLTAGQGFLHEVFHDGRHLLGVPCH